MSNEATRIADRAAPPKTVHVSLWIVQTLLALLFTGSGLWKLFTPVAKVAAAFPWAGQVPEALLRATGWIDLCGGVGIALPAITRIKPGLTPLAALGCTLLQICAIVFHVSRGEARNTPFNFLLVALSIFVFWGRRYNAPILPR